MDLDSALSDLFPAAAPFAASIVRPAAEEDLVALSTMKVGSTPAALKNLRAVHHQAARLLATGMKAEEVSLHTGLCSSRLSILKADPTFNGLVEHYVQTEGERFASVRDRMVQLGLTAADTLLERIIEFPEEISTKDLTELLKSTLDRGGHAPVTRSESKHLHATIPADALEALKGEILNGGTVYNKHEKLVEVLPASGGSFTLTSGASGDRTLGVEVPAGKGGKGPGTDV